ncbi:MAG: hypothetical protein GY953_32120 [bacterium]|nr:hypothetical protein [bacterium]
MLAHARAIGWAQIRTLRNFYPRGNVVRAVLTGAMSAVWYGGWVVGAVFVGLLLAGTEDRDRLMQLVPPGLAIAFLYWQVVPVLMASAGASLDLRRLLAYPIPVGQLFALEVLLRLSTGVEMLLVLCGAAAGLLANASVPVWAPVGLLGFALMNLFLSAGVKNLAARLLVRKYVKELAIIGLASTAALPQWLLWKGSPGKFKELVSSGFLHPALPFSAVSRIVVGDAAATNWLVLAGWVTLAYCFGRWQFTRSLRFDRDEAGARKSRSGKVSWGDWVYQWPSLLFRDPLAALVEKELRFLSRAPRFRLVFVMGFSFGLVMLLPVSLGFGAGESPLAANYLTLVSAYALALLAEATFWNSFGFDRAAAQLYFLVPADPAVVLRAKNIAAAVLVALEVTLVALACFLLRMPLTAEKVAEAYAVACVLTVLMLSAGNLASAHFPRPVDPKQSWRNASAGRFQAMLLLLYPVILFPVALAFLARYAFETNLAFYGVLLFDLALGGLFYWVAMGSAVETIRSKQESMLAALAERPGPVAT